MGKVQFGDGHWANNKEWSELLSEIFSKIRASIDGFANATADLAAGLEYQAFNPEKILRKLIAPSTSLDDSVKDMRDLLVARYTRGTSFLFNAKNSIEKAKDKKKAEAIQVLINRYGVKKNAGDNAVDQATLGRISQVLAYMALRVALQITDYHKPIIPLRPISTVDIKNAIIDVVPQFLYLKADQLDSKTNSEAALYVIHLCYQVCVSEGIMTKAQKDKHGVHTKSAMITHCMGFVNLAMDNSSVVSDDKIAGRRMISGPWGLQETALDATGCACIIDVVDFCCRGHKVTDAVAPVRLFRLAIECIKDTADLKDAGVKLKTLVDK
uniref:Nucleoprotein n=1 Tax=Tenuivirus oryzabrevis TaxID=3052762 RepID=C7C691_9VIRU|nr:nucleocapsid protein [Tenuivirus oryzabrevis]CBX26663.1 hypothetical protein [Tenuivirus oryzabrevis]